MSTAQLTPELLAQPARRAARVIARALLDDVRAAHARLGAPDAEALHDLRVALRRLRTWLRACRPVLDDTVGGKSRRAFRTLAHATNAARDAEVALAWLQAQAGLPPAAGAGHAHLVERLTGECVESARAAATYLAKRLPRATERLADELDRYWREVAVDDPEPEPPMAAFMAGLLRRQRARLARALRRVGSAEDVAPAHRARIAGKQLRYVLEPLDADPRVAELVERLKVLQDGLGEFHDAQLLAERILSEVEQIAGAIAHRRAVALVEPELAPRSARPSRRGLRTGLLEVARRAHLHGDEAFTQFRRDWSKRQAAQALRLIDELANELAPSGE